MSERGEVPADEAVNLVEFFQLERLPRVPVESYYDVVAQMVTSRTGNWATCR